MASFPNSSSVQAIAAMADGAARNRAITMAYFQLSAELRRRFPGAANWCTFATWASRQAGVTIRHEDLLDALRQRLHASEALRHLLREIVAAIMGRDVDLVQLITTRIGELGPLRRSGEAVARGNLKVFAEIGFEFARFLDRFDAQIPIAEKDLDDFIASLRDGDPPEGQGLLRQAFGAYRAAAMAPSTQARAEHLLFANLNVGYHEQVRLQPEIRAALDAAMIDTGALAEWLLQELARRDAGSRGSLRRRLLLLAPPVRRLADRVAAEVGSIVRELVTEHLMTLRLDQDVIRLGRDVQQPCPPDLARLQDPHLVELLSHLDPDPNGPRGSGAEDWSDFGQRMHFICELFRAWQQDERLFADP